MTSVRPGFYGKVPGLGDFVSRRLPRNFIDYWDDWLQTVVAASKSQLGENWLATYLSSPLWRFALSAGHCGELPWVGVLMPSVDRVGRYFPLTVAVSLPASTTPFAAIASHWFEAAETHLLTALDEENFDLETFSAGVEALGECIVGDGEAGAGESAGWGGLQCTVDEAGRAHERFHALLAHLMHNTHGAYSVWSTDGSDLVEPSLLACPGLPGEQSFAALLDGQWGQWQWSTVAASTHVADATQAPGTEHEL